MRECWGLHWTGHCGLPAAPHMRPYSDGGGVAELALSKLPSGGIGDAIPEGNPDSLISATVQTGHFLVVRHAMSMGRVVLF